MMWPTDALQLAATKLKTRKIRLSITIVITSLLFAVLAFLAAFSEGVIHSLKDFGKEGYGNRYLVQSTPITNQMGGDDKGAVDHFKPIQADIVAKKKASAKKLNLTYDEATDQSSPLTKDPSSPNGIYLNYASPLVTEYMQKKDEAIPGTDYASFEKAAKTAGATKTYRGTGANYYSGSSVPSVSVIKDGKESFRTLEEDKTIGQNGPVGIETITTIGWSSMDPELMLPFVLPGQTLATGSDGSIPTIAPASAAEELLGLKSLPQTASPTEKLNRLAELRSKVSGTSAQLCYRNSASAALVDQAIQQQKDIAANKNNKDYVKPTLIYQLPSEPCGAVTIKSDTRTTDEKKQAANQKAFDQEFGQYIEPEQGTVVVRVVGISPDISYNYSINATAILSSLFTSSMGGKWLSPNDAVRQSKLATAIQGNNVDTATRTASAYFAEFSSLQAMQAFIKDQTCNASQIANTPVGPAMIGNSSDFVSTCIKAGKVLSAYPYGNSAGAIEEFRSIFWKVSRFVLLAIVIIAALIMMGNVGKIIADSRRETAVFRALGAKRFDISQIYLTYTILLCVFITALSLVLGSLAAYFIHQRYTQELSVQAVLTYNAQDLHKQFALFGVNPLYIAAIAGLVLVAGLLAASLPLLTNTRRNPIRDMRDDT